MHKCSDILKELRALEWAWGSEFAAGQTASRAIAEIKALQKEIDELRSPNRWVAVVRKGSDPMLSGQYPMCAEFRDGAWKTLSDGTKLFVCDSEAHDAST
ncbi:hypothetical protein MnBA_37970 [Marinobacterium sp. BA1]